MKPPAAATTVQVRPDALLGWMGNLADPTRLRLLRLLDREELSVQELCEVLRLPQSTVSRHLKTLSDQGWLEARRHGTQSFYRLAEPLDAGARRLWKLARAETDGWGAAEQDDLRLEARLRARREGAQGFFAGAASDWDKLRSELYGETFQRAALLAMLPPEWTVADLGCGTGALTSELARCVARVVAVDQSAAMLRAARRRCEGQPNVELHRADLEALPVPDRSCDAALALLVLGWVPALDPVLAEVVRILKPGGRVTIVDHARHADAEFTRRFGQAHAGFEAGPLAAALAQAGFADSTVRPLPPEPGAKGPALFVATARRPGRRA
jgi:ArsR family transcriptional regulator